MIKKSIFTATVMATALVFVGSASAQEILCSAKSFEKRATKIASATKKCDKRKARVTTQEALILETEKKLAAAAEKDKARITTKLNSQKEKLKLRIADRDKVCAVATQLADASKNDKAFCDVHFTLPPGGDICLAGSKRTESSRGVELSCIKSKTTSTTTTTPATTSCVQIVEFYFDRAKLQKSRVASFRRAKYEITFSGGEKTPFQTNVKITASGACS